MSRALYKILVDDILRKIGSGEIAVGERLPPEAEYAESLGVSRSTLRQAFAQLEQNGIIKRRKRGGTEVISNTPVQKFNMVTNGLSHRRELVRVFWKPIHGGPGNAIRTTEDLRTGLLQRR